MTLSARLAEFATSTRFEQLPDSVVHAAERSLLDALGVSLAATSLGEGCQAFLDLVGEAGGRAESTVLGINQRVPAAAAAFANGALAHALDFEDAFDPAPSHPNAQVIPAVLALAERDGASGPQVLTAIAVGCDLAARLAAAAGAPLARAGWYPPPIVGGLAASLAGANLLRLSPRQALDALSLAVGQVTASGEVMNNPQSVIRGIRDAFPAQAAVQSVDLARRGIRGFDEPLEGPKGFFATYIRGDYEPSALTTGLGVEFAGDRVSFKPWPSCRGTHSFIEGALALRPRLAGAEVESVRLTGAPLNLMLAEPHATKAAPVSAIDAKFSVPFTVATALVDGAVTLASFTAKALGRDDIRAVADRVSFTADPALDTPAATTVGRIEVTPAGRPPMTHAVRTPLGSPQTPISDEQLIDKFVACAGQSRRPLAPGPALELARRVLGLRAETSVRALMRLTSPATVEAFQ